MGVGKVSDVPPYMRFTSTQVSVPLTGATLCGPDPSRVALMICAPQIGANAIIFVLPGETPTSQKGLTINTSAPNLILTFTLHGSMVNASWFAIPSTGTTNVTIVDQFYDPRDPKEEKEYHDRTRSLLGE